MSNMNNNCSACQMPRREACHEHLPIGMAYVPWQTWGDLYDLNKGLCVGTIFPCLDKPFTGRWPSK